MTLRKVKKRGKTGNKNKNKNKNKTPAALRPESIPGLNTRRRHTTSGSCSKPPAAQGTQASIHIHGAVRQDKSRNHQAKKKEEKDRPAAGGFEVSVCLPATTMQLQNPCHLRLPKPVQNGKRCQAALPPSLLPSFPRFHPVTSTRPRPQPCHGKYEAGKQTGTGKDHACPGLKSEPISSWRAIPGCCRLAPQATPAAALPFSPAPPPPPTTAPTAPVSQLGQLRTSATLPGAPKGGLTSAHRRTHRVAPVSDSGIAPPRAAWKSWYKCGLSRNLAVHDPISFLKVVGGGSISGSLLFARSIGSDRPGFWTLDVDPDCPGLSFSSQAPRELHSSCMLGSSSIGMWSPGLRNGSAAATLHAGQGRDQGSCRFGNRPR